MKFIREEDAVSPVIGVILMVAITVILAAIVASFVMGHAGDVDKPRVVETRVIQKNQTYGQLTLIKGPEGTNLRYLNVTMSGVLKASKPNPAVGDVILFSATPGNDHVVVVARFEDGQEQVVFDGYI